MRLESTFLMLELFISVGLIATLYFFSALGFWAGKRFRRSDPDLESVTSGDILTLLSLLLAFGVSMADTRYEARKETELDEANSIGTSYLRTSILPEKERRKVGNLLKLYLGERIDYYEGVQNDQSPLTSQLQSEFWKTASEFAAQKPSPNAALLLTSLNQTIDLQEKQAFLFRNRVPKSIRWLLLLVSGVVMTATGFSHGARGHKHRVITLALSVVIAMTLFVILDLDVPRAGLIRIAPESLLRLKATIDQSN